MSIPVGAAVGRIPPWPKASMLTSNIEISREPFLADLIWVSLSGCTGGGIPTRSVRLFSKMCRRKIGLSKVGWIIHRSGDYQIRIATGLVDSIVVFGQRRVRAIRNAVP